MITVELHCKLIIHYKQKELSLSNSYMAPEILENKNYSALCDVWALGIIMYYL